MLVKCKYYLGDKIIFNGEETTIDGIRIDLTNDSHVQIYYSKGEAIHVEHLEVIK